MIKRTFVVEFWVENEIDARDITDTMYSIVDSAIDTITGDIPQYKITSRDDGHAFNLNGARFQERAE